jgi:hypothetical protein
MRPWILTFRIVFVLGSVFAFGCEDESNPTTPEVTPKPELLAHGNWYVASPPAFPDGSVLAANLRQAVRWYNIEPELGAYRRDFDPTLSERENALVTTLDIELDSLPADPTRWTGIITGFASNAEDRIAPLDLSEFTFLDIWVNDFRPDPTNRSGTLYVDLGFIDEDFFEPDENEWNDEDQERDGFVIVWDDTGLDGKFNVNPDEVVNNPGITREEENPGGDPNVDINGDDYLPTRIEGRFTKINGTERNSRYDTEDLDGSGQMEELNAYFRYEIDLASEATVDIRRDYPSYDGFNDPLHEDDSWRLYRIPLSDYTVISTNGRIPHRDEITHVRIWTNALGDVFSNVRRMQLAEFEPTN